MVVQLQSYNIRTPRFEQKLLIRATAEPCSQKIKWVDIKIEPQPQKKDQTRSTEEPGI